VAAQVWADWSLPDSCFRCCCATLASVINVVTKPALECDADSVCFVHAAVPGACFAASVRATASASHEAIAALEVDRGLGQQQQAEWGGLCRILPAQSAPLPRRRGS
jgi:hypothetical protein